MFRLQENVPSTYVEQSRDFQLLCRLYDVVNNGVRADIDSMISIIDPLKVKESALPLLASRIGFVTATEIDNRVLRYILSAYPYIIKCKGTKLAIQYAAAAILKSENTVQPAYVQIVNGLIDDNGQQVGYYINIYLPIKVHDSTKVAFRELLKKIVPTGYIVNIYDHYESDGGHIVEVGAVNQVTVLMSPVSTQAQIRGSGTDSSSWTATEKRLVHAFDTTEIVGSGNYDSDISLTEKQFTDVPDGGNS